MKSIILKLSSVVIGAALLSPAFAAGAATTSVSVSQHAVQRTLVANNWGNTNTGINLQTWDVATAEGSSFLALCIEPATTMLTGTQAYAPASTFTFSTNAKGQALSGQVERLYGLYYDKITGTDATAKSLSLSFQLALWELYNDDRSLDSGSLIVNNTKLPNGKGNGAGLYVGADTVVTHASEMLAGANSTLAYTQHYTFTKYASPSTQDFVVATAVPEPSTYAMLGLGLALVGFTARRRKQG